MISDETLAAALRVDQYSARRAMRAVRTETPGDLGNSTEPPDRAESAPDSADSSSSDAKSR